MPSPTLRVEKVSPAIGAEVYGVDLTKPLAAATLESLKALWIEHLVLFFHNQSFTIEQLQRFGQYFGELHIHPQGDVEGFPGIVEVRTDASSKHVSGHAWHTDISCDQQPPTASILWLNQVPASGGDTLFSNMYAAYDALSERMRSFLNTLTATHNGRLSYGDYWEMSPEELRDGYYPKAIHPVVATHPVTNKKLLFVNETFTERIEGLNAAESNTILQLLYRHIADPKFQCRFRWRNNSVALWDNRCTQHLAMWDYFPETRAGFRATIL